MDRQQAAFEQALAESEAASLEREGENLRITFKGNVYFDTGSSEMDGQMYSENLIVFPTFWFNIHKRGSKWEVMLILGDLRS